MGDGNKFLGKTGVPIKYRAVMYKSVVQAVLLYTRKIWVVMDVIVTVLEVFHHRIERRIAGMAARKGCCGEWECSWYHHIRILLEYSILSAPVHIFYIALPAT